MPKDLIIPLGVFSVLLIYMIYANYKIPIRIVLQGSDKLIFEGYISKKEVSVSEIISIKSETGGFINIKCRNESFSLLNNFTDFYELLGYLKTKNPDLIIYGI